MRELWKAFNESAQALVYGDIPLNYRENSARKCSNIKRESSINEKCV